MKIEIAVEDGNVGFEIRPVNFPFQLSFLDRTNEIIIDVLMDKETMKKLLSEITKKMER